MSPWLRRRLDVDTGFDPDRINMAFAAQVAACMYLGAAGTSILLALIPELGIATGATMALFALPLVGAVAWIVVFDRAPLWMLYGGMAFGTAIITVGAYLAEATGQGVALYTWGVIYAFVFFPRRIAVYYLAGVCTVYAVVLRIAMPEDAFLGVWLMASMTLATIGLVIGALRDRLANAVRRSEERAITDPLTGLPNRRALMEELDAALASGTPHRFMLCDLNGFKHYNDTRGHQEGDALLERLGDRLARLVDGRGRAYRLGGDEFCVLWPLDAHLAVRDVEHALSDRGPRHEVTAAHGDIELPMEAADADAALRIADGRMYAHKAAQRERRAAA